MRLPIKLSLALLVAACTSPSEPTGAPAVTGSIVARDVRISIGDPPTIHVKGTASEECGVVFLVTSSTQVLRRGADGKLTRASVSDLTVGRRVGVWATTILDSCPGQAAATDVEILEAPE
ncbi:MAG TPA: DUF3221 domain-containing protein [Gemmatimonadaceae bacterium]|nr:DUF3221 domain-containing protein [Gemmatimonadaceae bacterium]